MGKRIASEVRRALIAAAKTVPVVLAIDACSREPAVDCPTFLPPDASEAGTGGAPGSAGTTGNGGKHAFVPDASVTDASKG